MQRPLPSFTGAERKLTQDIIRRVRREPITGLPEYDTPVLGAPEVIVVKLPGDGIPPMRIICDGNQSCRYVFGSALCQVFYLRKSQPLNDIPVPYTPLPVGDDVASETEALEQRFLTQDENNDYPYFKERIYNPYKWRAYGKAAESDEVTIDGSPIGLFILAQRERNGLFVCERPDNILKCIPAEDILPDSHGSVYVYRGGTQLFDSFDNPVTEDAWLNWMHGGQKVSAGKESLIRFFEDENKWVIVGAECEIVP